MTTTPPPEGTTEPRGWCGICGPDVKPCRRICPDWHPSPPVPAAEDDAVLDRKPVRNHPDAEASNALASFVIDRMHPWVQGGYVAFSARYGIAGDFLHWLDEHRPGWRDDAAGVSALAQEVERQEAVIDNLTERAEAAEAEVEAYRRNEVTLNGEVSRARGDARDFCRQRDEARQQVADLRVGVEALLPGETVNVHAGGGNLVSQRRVIDPDRLRAALARSGEQPGEVTRVEVRGRGYGKTQAMAERVADAVKARGLPAEVLPVPAPVVPDSAGLRERAIKAVQDAVDGCIDYETERLIVDAVLAVVGQGVTAEQAWDEGHREGRFYWMLGRPNPYRVRSGEQGGGDRG